MYSHIAVVVLLLAVGVYSAHEEFLIDTKYSIQCNKDDGALTLVDTKIDSEKKVILEPWQGKKSQEWFVENFQSIGRYEISPSETNSSATNPVTYQDTKDVYTFKRQWKVTLMAMEKYQIRNTESSLCLTGTGLFKEVKEMECQEDHPMITTQLWKFRILKRNS